jgi:SAM-dependent methyltransferase
VRIAKEGLGQFVDVRPGDATDLQFSDGTFDFIVAAQVYCYVPDVSRAVREAARVLKKGGRLVILDSDWDMCVWASHDPSLSRLMAATRGVKQFAHAHLPRQVHALILSAGMRLASAQCFAILETHYDADSYGVGIIPHVCDTALKHGIPAEDVARWKEELRGRTSEGEWFFCLNRFVFTALK